MMLIQPRMVIDFEMKYNCASYFQYLSFRNGDILRCFSSDDIECREKM